MRVCPCCGHDLPDDARPTCPHCGCWRLTVTYNTYDLDDVIRHFGFDPAELRAEVDAEDER